MLYEYAKMISKKYLDSSIRVHIDVRNNYSAGYKFNYWDRMGVPIRLDIGFRELKN